MPSSAPDHAPKTRVERIRIAHCIHGLGLGGAQQIIKYLVAGGDKETYQHFVYSGKDGVFTPEVEAAGAVVRTIPRRLPKLDPLWAARLAAAMRSDRIDIVHTHLFGDSLHAYFSAKAAGDPPVIMTLHNATEDFSRLQLWAYGRLLPSSSRAVACSRSAHASFQSFLGGDAPNMVAIPNGFDADAMPRLNGQEIAGLRAELGVPPGAQLIGAVGRLVEQKGFGYLISAFSRLSARSSRELRLVLLGTGADLEALERRAKDEGVGDSVIFAGFRSDAKEVLMTFDVLAISSLYEGLPVALLEAMAASRCIVATEVSGIVDVLKDGDNALLVPARHPDALAVALERALADEELRTRLGKRANESYFADYTASRMVGRYEDLYRDILEGC